MIVRLAEKSLASSANAAASRSLAARSGNGLLPLCCSGSPAAAGDALTPGKPSVSERCAHPCLHHVVCPSKVANPARATTQPNALHKGNTSTLLCLVLHSSGAGSSTAASLRSCHQLRHPQLRCSDPMAASLACQQHNTTTATGSRRSSTQLPCISSMQPGAAGQGQAIHGR